MTKRYGYPHPKSLAASRDSETQSKIRKGHRADAATLADLNESLSEGYRVETYEEYQFRMMARNAVEGGMVESLVGRDVAPREAEAVARYWWGDQLPQVRLFWEVDDYDGMGWALLAEHEPWGQSRVAESMGVTKGTVSKHLNRAAQKLGTDISGLRGKLLKGLVHAKARQAWGQMTPEQRDRAMAHGTNPKVASRDTEPPELLVAA